MEAPESPLPDSAPPESPPAKSPTAKSPTSKSPAKSPPKSPPKSSNLIGAEATGRVPLPPNPQPLPPDPPPLPPAVVAAAAASLPMTGGIEVKKPSVPPAPLKGLDQEFKGLFVSEWLTNHPLNMEYPHQIWLHADCPPLVTPEEYASLAARAAAAPAAAPAGPSGLAASAPSAASSSVASELPLAVRVRIEYVNRAGLYYLQEGRYDEALSSFKEVEKAVKDHARQGSAERMALMAVAHNNTAGFYYRKQGFAAVALQYAQKAAALEARVHGQTDFATHLRLACCCAKNKSHKDALGHCVKAIDLLRDAAAAAAVANARERAAAAEAIEAEERKARHANSLLTQAIEATGGAAGAPGLPADLDGPYHAFLAVGYHNLGVCYARCDQLQEANAMLNVADELAARALPAKHRWAKQICATVQRLRDLHLSTSFVTHSLRPRLAVHQARQAASEKALRSSASTVAGMGGMGGLHTTSLPHPAGGRPRRRQEEGGLGASASLPQLAPAATRG